MEKRKKEAWTEEYRPKSGMIQTDFCYIEEGKALLFAEDGDETKKYFKIHIDKLTF